MINNSRKSNFFLRIVQDLLYFCKPFNIEYMRFRYLYILFYTLCITGCVEKKSQELTPWGTPLEQEPAPKNKNFSLSDIQESGELIMLTMSGPDTYFDYHGIGMGTQFLLCEKYAQHLGVSLRVETCKSTAEMLKRLDNGDADIIVYQMPKKQKGTLPCGYAVDSLNTAWAVNAQSGELADSINSWYDPKIVASIRREEQLRYSMQSIHRRTYAPMLNAKAGVISKYDMMFMRYAPMARWDWRLLAAQCYQESCFDPKAYSWAGARGLMQIMPATAAQIGLPESKMYDPEENIYAAVRYIIKLTSHFQDIRDPRERQLFVLGSYNGGFFHIRDAMALAKKDGKNPHRWDDVSEYVLKLSMPQYYNDPVVKYGYMRGQETATYVSRIRDRWAQYRGVARGSIGAPSIGLGPTPGGDEPHKAHKKHRFKL